MRGFTFLVTIQTHTAYDYGSFPCRVVVGKTAKISIRFTPSRCVWQSACKSQARQQRAHDSHSRARAFQVGDQVYARNFLGSPVWMEENILDKTGSVSFRIRLSNGRIWKRNIDHVRTRYPEDSIAPNVPEELVGPEQFSARETADTQTSQGQSSSEMVPPVSNSSQSQQPRHSGRICHPPERLC